MSSVNKVILIGNLGKDPEMRYLPSGEAIANFSIACSETWTDKQSGEKKEHTEWVRCSFFGRTAEVCGEYLKKGAKVYVEGSLRTRKWQDKDGQDRYTTEVRGDQMRMLDRKGDGGGDDAPSTPARSTRAKPTNSEHVGTTKARSSGFDDLDDDVPFN